VRRRIAALTAAVAAVAVLMLGVPLVILGRHEARSDARARVDREADAIAFALATTFDRQAPVSAAVLQPFARDDRYLTVRDTDGNVARVGRRPAGRVITARVTRADGARIILRVDAGAAGDRAHDIALAVTIFGLVAVTAAAGVGWLLARRVTAPLDELANASARLGAGDFSVSVARHGIPETDAVADALEKSAGRIDALVQAEREFSANASHQLRSPLTALRMRLEELAENRDPGAAQAEAEAALEQADRLDETITEMLALARRGRVGDAVEVDLAALVKGHGEAWRPGFARAHRSLDVDTPVSVLVLAHPGGVGQALDALVDNALRHGSGTVTVSVRAHRADVEIVVADEGPGLPDAVAATAFERHVSSSGGTGVGLALARNLAGADGGTVDLVRGAPTRFRLRIPVAQRE